MQSTRSVKRQSALHMFASEYGESTLSEKGSGEFDPSFVITKLGSRVNRVIVAGLLERIEGRDVANGSVIYQGQLRDPSGINYFSVGDYVSDSVKEMTIQLSARLESGEPVLVLMVAKTRLYQTEEGAIYTSLRPEEMCVIDAQRYASWLAKTSQSLMERMSIYVSSLDFDANFESLSKSDFTENPILGLVSSRNHYGDIDLEHYRLNVMQALDIAEGKLEAATKPAPQRMLVEESSQDDGESEGQSDLETAIIDIITKLDQGDGVEFETILVK
jgi:RPA family protein